jgi:hypothetical protein
MSDKLKSFEEAEKNIQQIIVKVLDLEKEKLSQKEPRLGSEVVDIVKMVITENDLDQNENDGEENL